MNATDLTSFERLSRELQSLVAGEGGARAAMTRHLASPNHWFWSLQHPVLPRGG